MMHIHLQTLKVIIHFKLKFKKNCQILKCQMFLNFTNKYQMHTKCPDDYKTYS